MAVGGAAAPKEREGLGLRILEVGLVGIPNAGKSELTNQLVGHKITAVSSKKNTTIQSHLGAYISKPNTQIVLHDLPGVLRQSDICYKGQRERVEAAWCTAEVCNVVTFLVDAAVVIKNLFRGPNNTIDPIMFSANPVFDLAEKVQKSSSQTDGLKIILALNKIDLIPKEKRALLHRLERVFTQRCNFERSFFLSALTGQGLQSLRSYFHSVAKKGQWKLPSGLTTDKTIEDLALELIRDKLFRRLNREIPYILHPEIVDSYRLDNGRWQLDILIPVPNDNVKRIVVGHRGSIIQEYVTERTKRELEQILNKQVVLNVKVKAKK